MNINIHAAHNPDGKVACGAVGLVKESTEARKVKDEVVKQLKSLGHTVYDCTCNDGTSQNDVLARIVKKCNENSVDLDVSIHFNAGAGDKDGNTTGTEVLIYSTSSNAKEYAESTCKAIADLGFRNRGVKTNTSLYYLRKTVAPAMLVECCFVDDKDDVALYDYKSMASAIVYGITGQKCEFKVKVKLKSLPIRKKAKTLSKKMGSITDKGTYTIVKVNKTGAWGKLKSGAGWIRIGKKYVERL